MPANDLWRCEVCSRTMQLDQREAHEAGIKHTKKLGLGPAEEWTCVLCGRTMMIGSKASHEGGTAHLKVLARQKPEGEEMWTCGICDRTMLAGQTLLHLEAHLDATRTALEVAAVQEVDPVAVV